MFIPFSFLQKRPFRLALFVLLLLSGCGQPSSVQHPPKASPLLSGKATSTPSGPVSLGTSVAFDLGGRIHVQSTPGFTCSFGRNITPGTLVLPTVQPTYDEGTLQSVKNYVTVAYQVTHDGLLNTASYPPFSANPNAFQLVPVNSANIGCHEILQVTNIGNVPLQVTQVSVKLTADTQTNNQHHNLIDLCSLNSSLCGPLGGAEASYLAEFDLPSSGKTNTIMPATCWGYATPYCSPQALSLKPGEVAQVYLSYFSSTSDNLSFSLLPTFTLDWPGMGKPMIYSAPQLQVTFAFASISQFSCYALQGQQFIEEPVASHLCM